MEDENKPQSGNQTGQGIASPKTKASFRETIQSGEKIIEGARNEDQLARLKDATPKPEAEAGQDDLDISTDHSV